MIEQHDILIALRCPIGQKQHCWTLGYVCWDLGLVMSFVARFCVVVTGKKSHGT